MSAARLNSSSMSFVSAKQTNHSQASAPTLVDKLFSFFVERATTAPSASQGAIFLVDGHPIFISTSKNEIKILDQDKIETFALTDQLNAIRDLLGLTVTQISELFKVTRKTVYDWYDGADPRSVFVTRITALYHVLRFRVDKMSLKCLKHVWNLPINGHSFIDLINTTADQHELELILGHKLDELAPRMIARKTKVSMIDRDSGNNVMGGIIRDADSR